MSDRPHEPQRERERERERERPNHKRIDFRFKSDKAPEAAGGGGDSDDSGGSDATRRPRLHPKFPSVSRH